MSTQRQRIVFKRRTLVADYVRHGNLRFVFRFDDDLLLQARGFVAFHLVGDVLFHAFERDPSGGLGDDNGIEGVPFDDLVALLHGGAVVEEDLRTVGDVVVMQHNLRVRVYDAQFGQTADYDLAAIALRVYHAQLIDLQHTVVLGDEAVFGSDVRGDTADVECTQCKLCTRLTDGLSGDDADHFTLLHHATRREVAAVALGTDALLRFARKHRADLDTFDRRFLDLHGFLLANLFTRVDDDFTRDRVNDIMHRYAAQDTFVERGDDVFVVLQFRADEAAQRTAVFLVDDHVVRDVYKSTRQVSGVGCLEGSVGQTFSGTVGGDKVLQHGESLFEVRKDRVLDDLTAVATALLRLGHQTTHARKLTDLLFRSTSTGIHHHVDGVEAVVVRTELIDERLGELTVDVRPGVDNLVVTLVVGDEAHVVVGRDLLHFVVSLLDDAVLFGRDKHVGQVERQATLEGHVITEVLDVVEELCRTGHAAGLDHVADDVAQGFLAPNLIDVTHFFGYELIDHESAHGGLDHVTDRVAFGVAVVDIDLDRGVDVELLFVVSDTCLLWPVEDEPFAAGAFTELGDVIESEHHVLRGHGDGGAVGRVEDVMRSEHEHLRFEHGLVAQRQMDSHLVTVEVGVESGTGQGVELNGFPLDHLRLEGLDTKAVKRRSTVEEHGMTLHDVFKDVPHDGLLTIDNLFGRLDCLDNAALDELTDDEWLIEFGGHVLRQTAFVHLQLGANDDDGARRIVDTFTEQVLAEASLLTLQTIGERFEEAVGVRLDGARLTRVVEERIDGLLEHALLVAEDDFRGADVDEPFETVVADDDTTIEVVQVGGGEASTIERNERTQLGRNDGHDFDDHPLRTVAPL